MKKKKNNWRSRKKTSWGFKRFKPKKQTKAIEGKSDDKLLMEKETYSRLLGERLNEMQEISKKIDFKNLTYYFKTSSISPINFIKFKCPFVFVFFK